MNLLEALPAIGSFLAGPAGTIAGAGIQWLAGKLGASEATVDGIKQTLSGMTPEQLLRTKELDIEFQKFCLDNGIKLQLAQIKVNEEAAKNPSFFVAGARPAAIWCGVIGLGYAAFVEPIMRFVATVMFGYMGAFPAIDTTLTMQVLFGLLGLGAMRSWDKYQGTDTKRITKKGE